MPERRLPQSIVELYHDQFSEIPLLILDCEGVITYANKAIIRRLRCSDPLPGQPVSSFMDLDLSMDDPVYEDAEQQILVNLITTSISSQGEQITLRGHLFFNRMQYVAIFDIFKQHHEQILEQVTRLNLEMSSMTRNYSKQYEIKNKQAQTNRELALHDQLTGLGNRRKFSENLSAALSGEPGPPASQRFGIIMFDIDDFKRVNDTYGHDVGDEVLKSLSQTVSELIREQDIPARYGGEEFIILAHCSEISQLRAMAEKIRATVAARAVPSLGRAVTASFGITMRDPRDSEETLIKRADEAMYAAKRQGKNCVAER